MDRVCPFCDALNCLTETVQEFRRRSDGKGFKNRETELSDDTNVKLTLALRGYRCGVLEGQCGITPVLSIQGVRIISYKNFLSLSHTHTAEAEVNPERKRAAQFAI